MVEEANELKTESGLWGIGVGLVIFLNKDMLVIEIREVDGSEVSGLDGVTTGS